MSWGGFTKPVKQDSKKEFFKIRLWDQGDVVDAILQNYERLDDEIKAELPLKQAARLAAQICAARDNEAYKRALYLKERRE